MTTPQRPAGVPETARYVADNDDGYRWVDGPVDEGGKAHGPTKVYADAGYLRQSCTYVADVPDGENVIFHPDGSVASVGFWREGKLFDALYHRPRVKSPEPFPGDVAENVETVRYCSRDAVSNYKLVYRDSAGNEVTDSGAPMPERPKHIDDDASFFPSRQRWILGNVLRGPKGGFAGTYKEWREDGTLVEHNEYAADGAALSTTSFFPDGSIKDRTRRSGDVRLLKERFREPGVLTSRTERDAANRPLHEAEYKKDGTLREERTWQYDGEALVSHVERGSGGATLFEVATDGDGLRCRIHDDGRLLAEGRLATDRLAGPWRIFDETGKVRTELDVTPYELAAEPSLRKTYGALRVAAFRHFEQKLPAVAGASDVAWHEIATCYGKAKGFDLYLKGLTAPEPLVQGYALGQIMSQIEHQGSVYPATAAVVPFLIRLTERDDVDRGALLSALQDVAQAASAYRSDAEKSIASEPEPIASDEGDWRGAILGTLDAVGEGWPTLASVLQLGTPAEQGLVISLAGFARARDLTPEILRIAREAPVASLRAIAVDALCGSKTAEPDALAPCLSDADPLVRMAAAIALGCRFGPKAPAGTDDQLADALADLETRKSGYLALPFVRAHPLAYLALAAGSVRTEKCFALATPIARAMASVDGVSATDVGRGLLALAFGRCERPFMPGFVDVLDALAHSEPFWAFNVNAAEVLRSFGLPDTALEGQAELRALVEQLRKADDAEAMLYAEMRSEDADADDDDE